MDILTIVLGIIVVVLALALFFQVKASREQAVEGQQLLSDYQKRVDELQHLLEDYNSLSKNFENVGKGYEQALLLFDKMAEIRQHLELITKNDKDPDSVARLQEVLKKFDKLHG
jgi:ribosomal protein S15P/S13E